MSSATQEPHYLYKELQSLLNRSLFDFLHEGSLDGIWYWDLTKRHNMWISPRFWITLGYSPNDMAHLFSEWKSAIFDEDLSITIEKIQKHLQDSDYPCNQVIRYEHKDGSPVFMRTRAMAIRSKSGKPLRIIAFNNNLTTTINLQESNKEQKERIEFLEQALLREATHDELTDTYNRRGLEESYKYLIEVAKRDGSHLSIALFHIDIESDRLGEDKFNTLIKTFSDILMGHTRRVDIIARFSDNEFILLLPNTHQEHSQMVVERVKNYIHYDSHEELSQLNIYVGIATKSLNLSDDTQTTYDILNLYVDEALHLAKKEEYQDIVHYQSLNAF